VLGSVAIHGLRKAEPRLGNSAAVFGQGVVGQLTVMLLKAAGCRPVIAADLVASRLEKSKISGADFLVDGSKEDSVEDVLRLTNRAGAELVFDATRTPKTLPLMMKAAAQAGKVLIVGSLPGTVEIDAFTELQLRELTIIGVFQPASPLQAHPYNPFTQSRNRLTFLNLLADGTLGAIQRKFVEDPYYEYTIDEALCIGCAKCVDGCNRFGNGSLYLQVRHDRCLNCNECSIARVCPSDAFRRVPASHPYLLKTTH